MRICQFPGCGAVLRQEPKRRKKVLSTTVRKFCSLHNRILIQNDVEYYHGRFCIWRTKKVKGGQQDIRQPISKQKVKHLKEIAPLEDFLSSEFESDKEAIKNSLVIS